MTTRREQREARQAARAGMSLAEWRLGQAEASLARRRAEPVEGQLDLFGLDTEAASNDSM